MENDAEKARKALNDAWRRGEEEFLPDTPPQKLHPADVRFSIASKVLWGAFFIFLIELALTWHETAPSPNMSLDTLRDTFEAFDALNAGVFTAIGAVIGFYFGQNKD